jgi:type II secretory pathway pseudopilin PulG
MSPTRLEYGHTKRTEGSGGPSLGDRNDRKSQFQTARLAAMMSEVGKTTVTMQRTHPERGYSAVELAVALSLAGIILAASAFSIRLVMARETIDGWARSVTYDIASGQQAAVTWRTTMNITFTSSSYLIAAPGGPTFRYAQLPSDISLTTTCPSNTCSFNRRGVPTAAGTITLTSASTGRSFVVTILSNTGSVSYQ